MNTYAIPLAALVISASSFIFATVLSARTSARTASSEWVRRLEAEVELLEDKLGRCENEIGDHRKLLDECRSKREELEQETRRLSGREIDLMRRILALENGSK